MNRPGLTKTCPTCGSPEAKTGLGVVGSEVRYIGPRGYAAVVAERDALQRILNEYAARLDTLVEDCGTDFSPATGRPGLIRAWIADIIACVCLFGSGFGLLWIFAGMGWM